MAFDPVSIAISVALTLASILLSARNTEVGELDNVAVDTGSYGRLLPVIYGTQLVTAQTIWIANDQLIRPPSMIYRTGRASPMTPSWPAMRPLRLAV